MTVEMILCGSQTTRTDSTPRLVNAGVEIVLAGAVQTLCGVLGWCGARRTADTSFLVLRKTDIVQEVAGGTFEACCAWPETLRTCDTALGVGIKNLVGLTAGQALAGVGRAWQ